MNALDLLTDRLGAYVIGETWAGWWRCPCGKREQGDAAALLRHEALTCPRRRVTPPGRAGEVIHPQARRRRGPNDEYAEARALFDARDRP